MGLVEVLGRLREVCCGFASRWLATSKRRSGRVLSGSEFARLHLNGREANLP